MSGAKIKGMLDPGHARNTAGKRAGTNPTFYEYLSNRNVAAKAKKLLEATGRFQILLSVNPSDPNDASLSSRAAEAVNAGCDFFVSIHSNAHNDTAVRGTETFIHTNSSASLPFAQALQNNLVSNLGTKNRGTKRADFGVLRGTYRHMMAALTEGEFYTNPQARAWMLTPDFENKYAEGLARGLCAFYRVEFKGSPVQTIKQPVTEPADDDGAGMIRVKVAELWTYNRPDWNAKDSIVKKDEAFTTTRKLKVGGGYMYKLRSGLYITANTQYIEELQPVQAIDQPKKEENKLEPVGIVVSSNNDIPAAEILAKKLGAPIFYKATAENRQVADKIIVCGGNKDGVKGSNVILLSGPDRFDAWQAIGNYIDKL